MMAIVSGRLYDRFGARFPVTIGLVLMVIGTILMASMPVSLYGMTLNFMVIQLGAGFWFGNNMAHAVSHVPVEYQSVGNSIFSATSNYAAAVGIAMSAGIISIFQKNAHSTAEMINTTYIGSQWVSRLDVILICLASALSLHALMSVSRKNK